MRGSARCGAGSDRRATRASRARARRPHARVRAKLEPSRDVRPRLRRAARGSRAMRDGVTCVNERRACVGAAWRNGARVPARRRLVARALGRSPCRACPVPTTALPADLAVEAAIARVLARRSAAPRDAVAGRAAGGGGAWPKPRARRARARSPQRTRRASRRSAPRSSRASPREVARARRRGRGARDRARRSRPTRSPAVERAVAALARELTREARMTRTPAASSTRTRACPRATATRRTRLVAAHRAPARASRGAARRRRASPLARVDRRRRHRCERRARDRGALRGATGASLVAEVAGWMPDAWQPRDRWCARARRPSALLQHRAARRRALPWMARRSAVREDLRARHARRGAAPAVALLRARGRATARPRRAARVARGVAAPAARTGRPRWPLLGALVHDARRARAAASATAHPADGWPLRRALQARLAVLFRRATLDPAAAFIFLALSALDLERAARRALRRARVPRAIRSPHDPPATRPLVRDPRRARRRDARARGARGAPARSSSRRAPAARCPRRSPTCGRCCRSSPSSSLRYHAYWPARPARAVARFPSRRRRRSTRSLARLRAWADDAEPLIQQLQRGEAERARAAALAPRAPRARRKRDRPRARSRRPARSCTRGCSCSRPTRARAAAAACCCAAFDRRTASCTRSPSARADELQPLAQQAARAQGPRRTTADVARHRQARRRRATSRRGSRRSSREDATLRAALAALHERHDLRAALGDASRLQWVLQNVRALESGDLFCWITGWTSDLDGDAPRARARPLGRARARCTSRRRPPDAKAPLLLANPRVGAAVRGLQPRARHAVAQRGRSERAARDRRAADVRLHVRRRRPGARHRRRRLRRCASAAPIARLLHRRRPRGRRLRPAVRQRVQPARLLHAAVDRSARRSADDPARAARRRRGAADASGSLLRCARGVLARRASRAGSRPTPGCVAVYLGMLAASCDPAGFVVAARRRAPCSASATRGTRASRGRRWPALARTRRAHAADPHQHAVVRARRRVRARARRAVVGDRRADGRAPTTSSSQALVLVARQRRRARARRRWSCRSRPRASCCSSSSPASSTAEGRVFRPLPPPPSTLAGDLR